MLDLYGAILRLLPSLKKAEMVGFGSRMAIVVWISSSLLATVVALFKHFPLLTALGSTDTAAIWLAPHERLP